MGKLQELDTVHVVGALLFQTLISCLGFSIHTLYIGMVGQFLSNLLEPRMSGKSGSGILAGQINMCAENIVYDNNFDKCSVSS